MFWISLAVTMLVAFAFVKIRRQRKASQGPSR
jgi:hypothetical protein